MPCRSWAPPAAMAFCPNVSMNLPSLSQHGVGLHHVLDLVVLQLGTAEAPHSHRRGRPRGQATCRKEVAPPAVTEVLKRDFEIVVQLILVLSIL